MAEVVTPHTRAAAAALRGTLTPVQLTRRLEREHSAAPLTPRQQAAARRLARNVITLPEGSAQRARDMINLEKWLKELEGRRSARLFIKEMQAEHEADFTAFGVAFDHYHSTHSDENRTLSTRIYAALRDAGLIETRTIEQAFDPQKHMFLPDRYVRGTCPRCPGCADHTESHVESQIESAAQSSATAEG